MRISAAMINMKDSHDLTQVITGDASLRSVTPFTSGKRS